MCCGVIIYSRLSSKRLPRKALLNLNGRPLLGHVIDRAKRIKGNPKIIVATSSAPEDRDIELFCQNQSVDCYRGSLNNVVARTIHACDHFGVNYFARICGDRPFFCPEITYRGLRQFRQTNVDIVTSQIDNSLPKGLTTEIIGVSVVKDIFSRTTNLFHMEHLTSYLYQNLSLFKVEKLKLSNSFHSKTNFTIDTHQDFLRAKYIDKEIKNRNDAKTTINDIITLGEKFDQINRSTQQ